MKTILMAAVLFAVATEAAFADQSTTYCNAYSNTCTTYSNGQTYQTYTSPNGNSSTTFSSGTTYHSYTNGNGGFKLTP
jgi:hypothetical protein